MSTAQELSSLRTAKVWLNSEPLTAGRLRGKVVPIDFWSYSCINWIRTLPYVRAWAEKYRDQGLVVIGGEWTFSSQATTLHQAGGALYIDFTPAISTW